MVAVRLVGWHAAAGNRILLLLLKKGEVVDLGFCKEGGEKHKAIFRPGEYTHAKAAYVYTKYPVHTHTHTDALVT